MDIKYNYTRYFQPSGTYNLRFTKRFINQLGSLDNELRTNPPTNNHYTYIHWVVPYSQPLSNDYYIILYNFAKLCQVKLQWYTDITKRDGKSIRIIGTQTRVNICHHLLEHFFKGHIQFGQWLKVNCKQESKKANYKDVRLYASKQLAIQRDTICIYIKSLLEVDSDNREKTEKHLENWILEFYKLDLKNYNTINKLYNHAISTKFYHKRMLL